MVERSTHSMPVSPVSSASTHNPFSYAPTKNGLLLLLATPIRLSPPDKPKLEILLYYCYFQMTTDSRCTCGNHLLGDCFGKIVRTIGQSAIDVECLMGKWIIISGKMFSNGMSWCIEISKSVHLWSQVKPMADGNIEPKKERRKKNWTWKFLNRHLFPEMRIMHAHTSHCGSSPWKNRIVNFWAIVVTRRAWNDCTYINSLHCNWPWRDYIDTLMWHKRTISFFHSTGEQRASTVPCFHVLVHDFRL